jgi:UDP-N-acetylglucosamine diphosphorylase / glucose-1-phosphate thymidylyltransferase / UDP-N-acetylgalactosamine diphosphorylase / glucosamine-1-phosphate N-acetyltransferase / galactosamine-1-phosphate N-acetyltransferase
MKKKKEYLIIFLSQRIRFMHEALRPSLYFSLSEFEHAALFEEGLPVWEALNKISSYFLKRPTRGIYARIDPRAYLIDEEKIEIGEGSIVEPGAYIQGPCLIGRNCQIRHGAYIRGYLITGDRCVIGHATEVKNAIFLNDVHASHFAYVGDSIIGNHVNLGAGTKLANLLFTRQKVRVPLENEKIETGMRKLGAILGDGAQTGCNSVLNPGTLIGKESRIAPCAVAKGILPARSYLT